MDELQGLEMPKEKIIDVDLEKEVKKSFLDYSMSVIVSRALPDVRDGLKPVHRRILYTMYENSLWPERAYRKCADTVGSVVYSVLNGAILPSVGCALVSFFSCAFLHY